MEEMKSKLDNVTSQLENVNLEMDDVKSEMENMKSQLAALLSKSLIKPQMEDISESPKKQGCINGRATSNIQIEDRSVQVGCEDGEDMNGAWTVIQRRGQYRNPQDYFYRTWDQYKNGFGSVDKEVWLGLQNMADLTKEGEWQLQVEMTDWDGQTYFGLYNRFNVGQGPKFQLGVSGFDNSKSTLGDSLTGDNGNSFGTKDKDQDTWSGGYCGQIYRGGWWYGPCGLININGVNFAQQELKDRKGMTWYHGPKTRGNDVKTWKASVMKIRRKNV